MFSSINFWAIQLKKSLHKITFLLGSLEYIDRFLLTMCQKKHYEQGYDILKQFISKLPPEVVLRPSELSKILIALTRPTPYFRLMFSEHLCTFLKSKQDLRLIEQKNGHLNAKYLVHIASLWSMNTSVNVEMFRKSHNL